MRAHATYQTLACSRTGSSNSSVNFSLQSYQHQRGVIANDNMKNKNITGYSWSQFDTQADDNEDRFHASYSSSSSRSETVSLTLVTAADSEIVVNQLHHHSR